MQFAAERFGQRVAERQGFEPQERAVFDVVLRTLLLAVVILTGRSRNGGIITPRLKIAVVSLCSAKQLGAVVAGP